MKNIWKVLWLVLFPLIFVPQVLAADVVVNEFLANPAETPESDNEWIELYNKTSSVIDISVWKLDDLSGAGSDVYTIPSGTTIDANGFKVFESSVTNVLLNNDSDEKVRLLKPDDTEEDSYSFSSTVEGKSVGRSTDGGGSWTTCASTTKNSTNNCPIPTPTPTPTLTPTPTSTPGPTATPTSGSSTT